MANRIFKFRGAKRRKIAIQRVRGAPDYCAFCAQSLAGSHLNSASKLDNADGSGPLAVICSRCIDQLAGLSKITGWYQRYNRGENFWPLLDLLVRKRLAGENGTRAMRDAVTALLLKLTKRACAIIGGQRQNGLIVCQKTGVSLAAPRIAIVTSDHDAFMFALYAGADIIGLPLLATTEFDASNGDAYRELKATRCNGDAVLTELGILIIADEFPTITDDVGVLYLCDDVASVPVGMEIIKI